MGFTRPLKEMSIDIEIKMSLGSRARPVRDADNPTAICEPTVQTVRDPQHRTTLYASAVCYINTVTYALCYVKSPRVPGE
jgi:hypothetical protein